MKKKPRLQQRLRHVLGSVFVALLLFGCASNPVTPVVIYDKLDTNIPLERIPEIIQQANTQTGDERHLSLLIAANALQGFGEDDWARQTLSELETHRLSNSHFVIFSRIQAQLALASGDQFKAQRLLWNSRLLKHMSLAPPEEQIALMEMRATLLFNLADYQDSIAERSRLDSLLKGERDLRELNQDLIWHSLMQLSIIDLELAAQANKDPLLRGWYRLAALSKDNQTNLRQQLQAVEDWAKRWPKHPASRRRPADLQLLKQLLRQQPRQIALLLPLSGRLADPGSAIRDGFMASYYRAMRAENILPIVRVYDSQTGDINAIYQKAIADGAKLVVGPLEKGKIEQLARDTKLTVPTLALNYISALPAIAASEDDVKAELADDTREQNRDADPRVGEQTRDSNNQNLEPQNAAQEDEQAPEEQVPEEQAPIIAAKLYQFGLSVEDEALQVAEQAWRDGHRRALIIAPSGTWGSRSVSAFTTRWQELGGTVLGEHRFDKQAQYSKLVAQALDITESKIRAREMRQLVGRSIEFEPRRRQDIDLIFLVGHAYQTKQLKPTLDFHYASKIPTYSTSHVYNGEENRKANQDMNGLRFTSLPWFFADALAEKQAIEAGEKPAAKLQRLYALGVDAYHIYPRLKQLEKVSQARFYGVTGTLSIDEQGRVTREPIWALFKSGKAIVMPSNPNNKEF